MFRVLGDEHLCGDPRKLGKKKARYPVKAHVGCYVVISWKPWPAPWAEFGPQLWLWPVVPCVLLVVSFVGRTSQLSGPFPVSVLVGKVDLICEDVFGITFWHQNRRDQSEALLCGFALAPPVFGSDSAPKFDLAVLSFFD